MDRKLLYRPQALKILPPMHFHDFQNYYFNRNDDGDSHMLNSASEKQFGLVHKHQARVKRIIQHLAQWTKIEHHRTCSINPWPGYSNCRLNSRCVHEEHYQNFSARYGVVPLMLLRYECTLIFLKPD